MIPLARIQLIFIALTLVITAISVAHALDSEIKLDRKLPTLANPDRGYASDLLMRALSLIGVRYQRGGAVPETGLDCSGMVSYVFNDTLGISLPRRAEEISQLGQQINLSELQPGDLVFYNTLRRAFSHVGIYLGNQRFIHAPSSGGGVRIEDMNMPYWSKRFNGARRLEAVK